MYQTFGIGLRTGQADFENEPELALELALVCTLLNNDKGDKLQRLTAV